jgi:uncharacterized protein (UPF0210 family)
MIRTDQVINTVQMIQKENLDVRTVTLGINLMDCRDAVADRMASKVIRKIEKYAGSLVETCDEIGAKYGLAVVNKRIAVSPAADVASHALPDLLRRVAASYLRAGS